MKFKLPINYNTQVFLSATLGKVLVFKRLLSHLDIYGKNLYLVVKFIYAMNKKLFSSLFAILFIAAHIVPVVESLQERKERITINEKLGEKRKKIDPEYQVGPQSQKIHKPVSMKEDYYCSECVRQLLKSFKFLKINYFTQFSAATMWFMLGI